MMTQEIKPNTTHTNYVHALTLSVSSCWTKMIFLFFSGCSPQPNNSFIFSEEQLTRENLKSLKMTFWSSLQQSLDSSLWGKTKWVHMGHSINSGSKVQHFWVVSNSAIHASSGLALEYS